MTKAHAHPLILALTSCTPPHAYTTSHPNAPTSSHRLHQSPPPSGQEVRIYKTQQTEKLGIEFTQPRIQEERRNKFKILMSSWPSTYLYRQTGRHLPHAKAEWAPTGVKPTTTMIYPPYAAKLLHSGMQTAPRNHPILFSLFYVQLSLSCVVFLVRLFRRSILSF